MLKGGFADFTELPFLTGNRTKEMTELLGGLGLRGHT